MSEFEIDEDDELVYHGMSPDEITTNVITTIEIKKALIKLKILHSRNKMMTSHYLLSNSFNLLRVSWYGSDKKYQLAKTEIQSCLQRVK